MAIIDRWSLDYRTKRGICVWVLFNTLSLVVPIVACHSFNNKYHHLIFLFLRLTRTRRPLCQEREEKKKKQSIRIYRTVDLRLKKKMLPPLLRLPPLLVSIVHITSTSFVVLLHLSIRVKRTDSMSIQIVWHSVLFQVWKKSNNQCWLRNKNTWISKQGKLHLLLFQLKTSKQSASERESERERN